MTKPSKDLIGTCVGTLMGDSWIDQCKISFEHAEADNDYVLWKKQILDTLSQRTCLIAKRAPRFPIINGDRIIHNQPSVYCRLNYTDLIKELKRLMYNADGKKIITKTALDLVTPEGFAMWYFDDGSFNYSQIAAGIYTNGFTLPEQSIIQQWLKEKYGICANIVNKSKSYCLYFKRDEALKILAYIESNCPNIPNCMRRKIPIEWKQIQYRDSYKWNRLSYALSDYDAKESIKANLIKYHQEIDQTNIDKSTYFNILGYKNWEDSYSMSKAIRRVFTNMEAALVYANLPIQFC